MTSLFTIYTANKYSLKIILMAVFLFSQLLTAEPYIAVRTGLKCSSCHVNITGGGKRTEFGNIFIQRYLSSNFVSSKGNVNFSPQLSRFISLGGNLRIRNTATYGYTHTDTAGTKTSAEAGNFLDITEGNIYLEVKLITDRLTFYIDQMVSPNPDNREAFGLLQGLPGRGYLKAGKILLPYGYRLWDDEIYIRESTGFTYSDPDIGLEIGFEPGNYSAVAAVTGNQVSAVASWVRTHYRLGLSWQKATDGSNINMIGIFSGFNAGRFTFLGEIDQIELAQKRNEAYFAEMNFLLIRGLNFKITYNLFNPNLEIPLGRDGQERITFGIEVFPIQFFQLALFYNLNSFIPQNLEFNQNSLGFEMHFFF
ncbi:MAG: hypothetical protein V3S48_04510 [Candidatus Neomarinimicrobiota bacterium]